MNIKNYKTNKYSVLTIFFTITLLFIFSILFTPTKTTFAASTVAELQAMIDEKSRNIDALNKEIELYSNLSDKTSAEGVTLQKKIKSLTQNGKMLDADIKKTKTQIDVANLAIKKLGINIQASTDKVSHYQSIISEELKNIQYSEDSSLIVNLLSQRNISDVLMEIDNLRTLNEELKKQIDTLGTEKKVLVQNKTQKEETKKELTTLQIELTGKKKVVEANTQEQSQILKETKSQEKIYQDLVKQRQAQKLALEKELFDYESTLKYTLNPALIPKPSLAAMLSWPLDKVTITQLFGKTSASARLYVSGTHNGVDFGAKLGTPAKATASGVIIGAGDTDLTCKGASFGRWVLIKHDNGLATIYGHLSVIGVKEGQKVAVGDIIGYTGNTGYSTGPHLHISVYDGNAVHVENRPSVSCGGKIYRMPIAPIAAYLDPMVYFPKK
ncbi:MAG: peptidoglycan DD-metalloendopeptidase family protein [bacterium]